MRGDAGENVGQSGIADLAVVDGHVFDLSVRIIFDQLEIILYCDALLEANVSIAQKVVAVVDENQRGIN